MKETKMSTTTMTTLPVESIMEILSYLPAKFLLNSCKLVCKSWRIIVKEPDFVMMQLNRGAINGGGTTSSSKNSNSQRLLMCRSGNELFQLHLPFNFEDVPPNSTDDDLTVTITPTKLDLESFLFDWRTKLVDSCNGLLCIGSGEFVLLLNPCTRKYKLSPREPLQYRNLYMPISYGFGCFYDSTTAAIGEYKVVRIERSSKSDDESTYSKSEVKVYSMSANSWRTVKDIPNDILEMITKAANNQPGVLLNGALHWMSHETSDLVAFDMRSEEFRIMPPPPYDGNKDIKVLMILRGCLGMNRMIRIRGIGDSWYLEIWIMNEYGVSESWTHDFVIRLSSSHVGLYGLCFILYLDDQILYEGIFRQRLAVYDMNKKMSVYIDIRSPKRHGRLDADKVPFIESLVSLKSSELTLSKDKKRRVETLDTENKYDLVTRIRDI